MIQIPTPPGTQKVVQRLQGEGWVECPGLEFPALAQQPLSDLQAFVLEQLRSRGGRMVLMDLRWATLIFSVPKHQYEVHPHLPWALKRLEVEGVIEISKPGSSMARAMQSQEMVQLRAVRYRSLG